MATESDVEAATLLQETLAEFECVAGTVHWLEDDELTLLAAENVPEHVLERVETVPIGKGMAGVAAEREEPVQACNLSSEGAPEAEEGARETGMEGSIAAPMHLDGELAGVLGVAKPEEYEFDDEEVAALLERGEEVAERLAD